MRAVPSGAAVKVPVASRAVVDDKPQVLSRGPALAAPVSGTTSMLEPHRAAVIGRTGRGDYGHGLDVARLDQPRLTVVAVADENAAGRAAAAKRLGVQPGV